MEAMATTQLFSPLPASHDFSNRTVLSAQRVSVKAMAKVKGVSRIRRRTLSSNWDFFRTPSSSPSHEQFDTYEMLLKQRIVFLGSQTLKLPPVWRPCFYMYLSLALSLNIQEGMFYWYTDTSKGLSFSELLTKANIIVGAFSATAIGASCAYNAKTTPLKPSLRLIHARIRMHAQALTLAVLSGAAVLHYYNTNYGDADIGGNRNNNTEGSHSMSL